MLTDLWRLAWHKHPDARSHAWHKPPDAACGSTRAAHCLLAQAVAACTRCSCLHALWLLTQGVAACTRCGCLHTLWLLAHAVAACTRCGCLQALQLLARVVAACTCCGCLHTLWLLAHAVPACLQASVAIGSGKCTFKHTRAQLHTQRKQLTFVDLMLALPSFSRASRTRARLMMQMKSSQLLRKQGRSVVY